MCGIDRVYAAHVNIFTSLKVVTLTLGDHCVVSKQMHKKKTKHTYSLIGNVTSNIEANSRGKLWGEWVGRSCALLWQDNTQIFGSLCSVRKLLERIWYAAGLTILNVNVN